MNERVSWDDTIDSGEMIKMVNDKILITHVVNKSPMPLVDARDML